MVARRVRWRSGASRGPPARIERGRSSSSNSSGGGSSRTRAAASSIASGRPSSRRQISATAWALALESAKAESAARARRVNSVTAGTSASAWSGEQLGLPIWLSSALPGHPAAAPGTPARPRSRSRLRLVISAARRGQRASSSLTTLAPAVTCSMLSISRSASSFPESVHHGVEEREPRCLAHASRPRDRR